MCSNIQNHSRFQIFCNIIIRVFMILILSWLFLLSIFGTCMINRFIGYESTTYLTDAPLLHVSAILLVFLSGYLLYLHPQKTLKILNTMQNTYILLIVHILVAVLMLAAILICRYQPVADQYGSLYSAYYFLEGNYTSWEFSGFLYTYPMLNPLVLLFLPFVALFGIEGSAVAFQVFNLAMLLLASYSLYRFCKIVGLNSAVTSILFILYLPMTFYCFFIYGNISSLSLIMLAFWKIADFLKSNRIRDAVCSAAAITGASLLKGTAIIPLFAILIILAVTAIIRKKPKLLLLLPLFFIFLSCGNLAVDLTIEGITHEKITDGLSYYGHLTMGISEGAWADGWYNGYTNNLVASCNYDLDLYAVKAENEFRNEAAKFWGNPSYFIPFLSRKTASQWNNPTFQSLWIQQEMLNHALLFKPSGKAIAPEFLCLDGSPSNMVFYFIFNLLQSLILFGSLCYFIFDAKKASLTALLPAITFIGGFLFLLFWEAKAQYTILFFVLLIPYAVFAFPSFLKRCVSLKGKKYWYRSMEVIFLGILLTGILLLSLTNAAPINDTIKLGRDDQTVFYNYYLEQFYNNYR